MLHAANFFEAIFEATFEATFEAIFWGNFFKQLFVRHLYDFWRLRRRKEIVRKSQGNRKEIVAVSDGLRGFMQDFWWDFWY